MFLKVYFIELENNLLFLLFILPDTNDSIQSFKNIMPSSNPIITGFHTSNIENNKSTEIPSESTNHEDLINKKSTLSSTTALTDDDDHRTVLAHHIFPANIKHTIIRFMRETPV